jgi:ubiquitin
MRATVPASRAGPHETAAAHLTGPHEAATAHLTGPHETAAAHLTGPHETAAAHLTGPDETAAAHLTGQDETAAACLAGPHLTWDDVNDNNLSSNRPGIDQVRLHWGQPGAEWGPPPWGHACPRSPRRPSLMVARRG